jgi:hypothetical protein
MGGISVFDVIISNASLEDPQAVLLMRHPTEDVAGQPDVRIIFAPGVSVSSLFLTSAVLFELSASALRSAAARHDQQASALSGLAFLVAAIQRRRETSYGQPELDQALVLLGEALERCPVVSGVTTEVIFRNLGRHLADNALLDLVVLAWATLIDIENDRILGSLPGA